MSTHLHLRASLAGVPGDSTASEREREVLETARRAQAALEVRAQDAARQVRADIEKAIENEVAKRWGDEDLRRLADQARAMESRPHADPVVAEKEVADIRSRLERVIADTEHREMVFRVGKGVEAVGCRVDVVKPDPRGPTIIRGWTARGDRVDAVVDLRGIQLTTATGDRRCVALTREVKEALGRAGLRIEAASAAVPSPALPPAVSATTAAKEARHEA